MKNILYLHAGAELYGSDKVLLQLVAGLDKSKFNPIVVLPENGPLVGVLEKAGIKTEIVHYPILRRKYFNPKGLCQYAFGYLKSCKVLSQLAEKYQIDLIHVNTLAVLEGIILKKRIHKPLIWHVHEILLSPKFIWKLTAYLSAKYADKIVVVSNATGDHLRKAGYAKPNQIVTIYNGIKLPDQSEKTDFRQEFNIPKDAIVFGHVGRINAWKRQGDFLQASLKLMPDYPNMHILFSGNAFKGEEWREEDLKKKIQASDYADRIHYLGFQRDINRVYRTLNVLVSTSNGRETFSMVVAEAMADGKAIIAYNIGGPAELVVNGQTGYLARALDVDDLIEKMHQFIRNPALANNFGKSGQSRIIDDFSETEFVNLFQKLYLELKS
ncbi:glycosyl transferase family 1 [Oenococcus oeni]|uniref:Glycosyl transferase family 1 n=1 Tax=Oenococcus oeni TaxID=1247 RepID=A0A6N4A097_OENOE|nr:glycosyltransferase family 4 protein [Oenococcus oeni]OIM20754.1 glycosyl transferase family 1 [Oenococcus oeni]